MSEKILYAASESGYVYSFRAADFSTITSVSHGATPRAIEYSTYAPGYLYVGGDLHRVRRYNPSTLAYIDQSAVLADDVKAVKATGIYVYCIAGTFLYKLSAVDLSTVTSVDLGSSLSDLEIDGSFAYVAIGRDVKKYNLSDLSYTGITSSSYTGSIIDITSDGSYIYVGGYGSTTPPYSAKVRKLLKSDLTTVTNSPYFGAVIYNLAVDSDYVYAGDHIYEQNVKKYNKSDLSYIATSGSLYGTESILADDYLYVGIDDNYIYVLSLADLSEVEILSVADRCFDLAIGYGDVDAPTLTTEAVTDITNTTAKGHGTIVSIGDASVTEHGVCWGTSVNPTTANSHSHEGAGSVGPFESDMSLSENTDYHVRAYATTALGTSYGNDVTFKTYGKPTVSTTLVRYVLATTAYAQGRIETNPNDAVTAFGFCWSTSANPTIADAHTDGGATAFEGIFEHFLETLISNTAYHIRAYATNPYGTGYGADLQFTTLIAGGPVVTIQEIINIQETEATAKAKIESIGDSAVTEHGVCWGTSANPTTAGSHVDNGAGALGDFVAWLTTLLDSTLYYVRAYATNTQGTNYSDNLTFTTKASTEVAKPVVGGGISDNPFDPNPTWLDVDWRGDIMEIYVKRGRMHSLDRTEAGVLALVLNNQRGDYWRYNTLSPLYPYMKPMMLIKLLFRYVATDYPIYYGVLESVRHSWLDSRGGKIPIVTWNFVDIFKCFSRLKLTALPGTIGAHTNSVAMKTNSNSGQKVVEINSLGDSLTSGCDIKDLHVGQSVTIGDDNNSEVNTIASIDENAYSITMTNNLANNYTTADNGFVKKWPAVASGTRVTDVCYELGWPISLTTIDTGVVTIAELVPTSSGPSGMEHLQAVAIAEYGNIFIGVDGKLNFEDRNHRLALTSQATFSDDGVDNKYILPEPEDEDSLLYNEARIDGDAITGQVYRDVTAQGKQGPRCYNISDSVLNVNADAFDLAYTIVERLNDTVLRIKNLLLIPEADPTNLYPIIFGYDISTKITLKLGQPPNLAVLNKKYHIEGIEHRWKPGDMWRTKWQLWDVNLFRIIQAEHTGYLHEETVAPGTYTDSHDALVADNVYNDDTVIGVGQSNDYAGADDFRIFRGFLQFDTSVIGSGGSIESAEIILEITGYFVIDNAFSLTLCGAGSVVNPLVVADYNTLMGQTTSYGTVVISTPEVNKKVVIITLNAAGIAAINKTGTSYFGIRSSKDISSTTPGTGANKQEYITVETTAFMPRLIVKLHETF